MLEKGKEEQTENKRPFEFLDSALNNVVVVYTVKEAYHGILSGYDKQTNLVLEDVAILNTTTEAQWERLFIRGSSIICIEKVKEEE